METRSRARGVFEMFLSAEAKLLIHVVINVTCEYQDWSARKDVEQILDGVKFSRT